jgi:hypothetical protein
MMKFKAIAAVCAAAFLSLAALPSAAATVALAGKETKVEVTANLGGLGLSGAPFGTATADVSGEFPVFAFPITNGTIDTVTGNALFAHDGSGVTLSAGSISATVGNFLIQTETGTVFGDLIDAVTGDSAASGLALFSFGTSTARSGIELLISSTLAGALTSVFGAPDLTGAQFGFATPDLVPVPVPAAGVLLLGGLGLLGGLRARSKRAA